MGRVFTMRVLGRHDVDYFHCTDCGFLQTEAPYWRAEAYAEAIAAADTGLVSRNLSIARTLETLIRLHFDDTGRYVDYAGGTGLLVRLMRDRGFDFFWKDAHADNVHAKGFEYESRLGPCEAVTAFEVLEHVEEPIGFVRGALQETGATTFVFSTELYQGAPPQPGAWWYYCPETGQHISFFQRRTLERLAAALGMRIYSSGSFHVLSTSDLGRFRFRFAMSRLGRMCGLLLRRGTSSRTRDDHVELLARMSSPRTEAVPDAAGNAPKEAATR